MTPKKQIAGVMFLFFILVPSLSAETGDEGDQRVVPLPLQELQEVLSSWWSQAGFEVTCVRPDKGAVRIEAYRGDAACRFDLSPRSALSTRIQTTLTTDAVEMPAEMERWWHYIETYLDAPATETPPTGQTIPVAILSKIESVVCIRVANGGDQEQFSGIIVDKAGLVISTAHGLSGNQEMMVTLYDGRELQGALIRRDIAQDLSLIRIPESTFQSASLTDGRNLLGMGERIFSIGCVGNLQGTVTTGMINAPPRRVDDQPLWQVQMEIHPGNSGSPVFDNQGNLVALVKGRYRGTSSVGFLIPLETIIHFVKESSP